MSQFTAMALLQFREYLNASSLVTWLEELAAQSIRQGDIPRHLAFVMDGNRRFAEKYNIPIAEGHLMGADVLEKTLECCFMCNIQVVTIYSFSIENFQRPKSQVDALMEIFKHYLLSISKRGGLLERYGAKMRVLGRLELLEPDLMSTIRRTTDLTRDYGDKTLNVCLSYTSRDEIAGAIRQTVAECKIPEQADSYDDKIGSDLVRDTSSRWPCHISSESSLHGVQDEKQTIVGKTMAISPGDITAETITNRMLTAGDPPVDLLIRTSGASRLSDYLLWQCHQETQIMFRNVMWPDFGLWQFYSTIREWQKQKQKSMVKSKKKTPFRSCFQTVLDRIPEAVSSHCRRTPESIRRDIKGLRRVPEHLSVILSLGQEEDAVERLMNQIAEMVAWSACAEISTLSVYEKHGILKSHIPLIYQVITSILASYYRSPDQPVVCVSTPHQGPYCHSPALSASEKSGPTGITVLLLSESDGREALVDLTKSLAAMSQGDKLPVNGISIELINEKLSAAILQSSQPKTPLDDTNSSSAFSNGSDIGPDRPSSSFFSVKPEPDFLIIDGPYVKLDGYPPWQIRLTEMFCTGRESNTGYYKAMKYRSFLRALYQYAGAEMKFGR
ncbi:hypothetical protein O988_05210 [Pseudogymnoascus sp. VKM F-3808]|nr:hypothetical protein O988_05210 [Pseudogymnoascus sp. VKM F-3808]